MAPCTLSDARPLVELSYEMWAALNGGGESFGEDSAARVLSVTSPDDGRDCSGPLAPVHAKLDTRLARSPIRQRVLMASPPTGE
jgi:hypothetical protein